MFGKENPIRTIRTFKPGDEVIIVSNGRKVTIVVKGDGTNIGVKSDDGDSWVMSGDIAVRRA